MFRRTITTRFTHQSMNRMVSWVKKRDPNEKHLRTGHIAMEVLKRMHAYFLALFIVVAAAVYQQFAKPELVRPPVQDGRSLVT